MADQDIYKLVEQLNKNKISDNTKIDEIYNLLDSLKDDEGNKSEIKLTTGEDKAESSEDKKRTTTLRDLKGSVLPIKKPSFPSEIRAFENRSDCFFNILSEVDYGSKNNEDYVKGHKTALEKYYTVVRNNNKDLYVVEGQVNDELASFVTNKLTNNYNKGYYDGLEFVLNALYKSKDLISKKIYQELLKELG